MLEFYIRTEWARQRLASWLEQERRRLRRSERGMSETIQNVLLAVFAIAAVAIVWAAVQTYLMTQAAKIK